MNRYRVAALSDLNEGEGVPVDVEGTAIALFRRGQEVTAVGDSCPHMGAALSDGYLDDETVVCPWHGWVFELETGRSTFDEESCIPVYRTVVEGDDVFVELPAIAGESSATP